MLGKTAGGLTWMFRYLERSENIARLVEAGFRMGLTHTEDASEWESIVTTAAVRDAYLEQYEDFEVSAIVDFLLRDRNNPTSVLCLIEGARNNARLVRTAITREVWEAVNDCWITLNDLLAKPIRSADLPDTLGVIRQKSSLVRGALHGTMLRNDIFNFCRAGTFLERADSTCRILDVKYYILLPSVSFVGSAIDNVQWETILRCASAQRAFRWLYGGDTRPSAIADFLIFDRRMPRSLAFCVEKLCSNLTYLEREYDEKKPSLEMTLELQSTLSELTIDQVFKIGLHEFLQSSIVRNNALAAQIEQDYRFTE